MKKKMCFLFFLLAFSLKVGIVENAQGQGPGPFDPPIIDPIPPGIFK